MFLHKLCNRHDMLTDGLEIWVPQYCKSLSSCFYFLHSHYTHTKKTNKSLDFAYDPCTEQKKKIKRKKRASLDISLPERKQNFFYILCYSTERYKLFVITWSWLITLYDIIVKFFNSYKFWLMTESVSWHTCEHLSTAFTG